MGSVMPGWVQAALAVTSWGLVIGAWVFIALWAWGKRGAGVRWCGKCLYDMTGLPGMRCPECGRKAKSERQLRRRKRRWWALGAALALFALNYAMWVPGRVQAEGWKTALVPTGVLVMGLPWVAQERELLPQEDWSANRGLFVRIEIWDPAFDLLKGRIDRDELSAWHWEAVGQIGRCFEPRVVLDSLAGRLGVRGVRQLLNSGLARGEFRDGLAQRIKDIADIEIKTREVWPQGARVKVDLDFTLWNGQERAGVVVRIVDEHGDLVSGLVEVWRTASVRLGNRYQQVEVLEGYEFDGVPPPGKRTRYTVWLSRREPGGKIGEPFARKSFEVVGGASVEEEGR